MMKTKNILLAVAFMACGIGAAAQDVTILHMKDGTTKRYTNGVKEKTSIEFYEYVANENSESAPPSTFSDIGYRTVWNLGEVWKIKGEYVVGIGWEDRIPSNFAPHHGVILGTEPGLTVDNCKEKGYVTSPSEYSKLYIIIGAAMYPKMSLFFMEGQNNWLITANDTIANRIVTSLEKGKTYYYRIFAEGKVSEGGKEKDVVFYGDEHSFRVPRVMEDFGYYSQPKGTKEAVEAFAAAHFPDSVSIPTWQQMEPLWNKWRATDEGKCIDLSADITSETFDDGTGYRLNRIPDEFYTWMANREIVIDPFNRVDINKIWDPSYRDSVYLATCDSVTDVDAKWGVPGGKYTRFLPTTATTNYRVTYRSNEAVPGVRYKLQFNFAPETDADADSVSLRPTKVRISASSGSHSGTNADVLTLNPETGEKSQIIVPATEATSFVVDSYLMDGFGADLIFDMRTSNVEIRKGTYNRIMRIAEIRLTPIKDE